MREREVVLDATTEKFPWAPEEQLGKYLIRRWTFREKQEALIRGSHEIDEREGLRELDAIDYQIEQMLVCLREHPPKVLMTKEYFGKDLDADLTQAILVCCRMVNGPIFEEQRDFLSRSASTEDTRGSQNTGPSHT